MQTYTQSSEGQADVLAANEVATHVMLQQRQDSPHVYHLLGGFEVQDEDPSLGKEQVATTGLSADIVIIFMVSLLPGPDLL